MLKTEIWGKNIAYKALQVMIDGDDGCWFPPVPSFHSRSLVAWFLSSPDFNLFLFSSSLVPFDSARNSLAIHSFDFLSLNQTLPFSTLAATPDTISLDSPLVAFFPLFFSLSLRSSPFHSQTFLPFNRQSHPFSLYPFAAAVLFLFISDVQP